MNKIIPGGTGVLGLLLAIAGAVLLWAIMPGIIRNKVADEVYISINNNSEAYKRFEKLPVPLKFKVYFFNISNYENWKKDYKSLKFTEIGPYVWDEFRHKEEITFNESDKVTYLEKKTYTFNSKESTQNGKQLKENDQITIVNPITGLIEQLVGIFDINSIAHTDEAAKIAFNGMSGLGQSLFKCDQCEKAVHEVNTGKNKIQNLNQLLKYEGSNKLSVWNATGTCNDVHGTDGTQFHPDVKKEDTLYVFEPMLCRTIKFKNGLTNQEIKGISTLRFYAVDDNFERTKENECYCHEPDHNDCPAGTLNLRKCSPAKEANIDIISTQPYFKNNRDILNQTGLKPPKELTQENYGTVLDIEPYTGLALTARKRLQLNLLLKNNSHKFLTNLEHKFLYMPVAWIEESGDLDDHNANELKEKIFKQKNIFQGILIGLMAAGVLLVAIAGGCAYFGR